MESYGDPSSPRELLECIQEKRRACAPLRGRFLQMEAVQIAYATGRQWMAVDDRGSKSGTSRVEAWDQDWNGRTGQMKVVDNRIGRYVRQVAAQTSASRVGADIRPMRHQRGFEHAARARSASLMIDGISSDSAFTRAYRSASCLRWNAGSSLVVLETVRMKSTMDGSIVANEDGTPVVVDDAWIRWRAASLTELCWEPSNRSPDLADHDWLIVERPMSVRAFEKQWGPLEDYGIRRSSLPRLADIAGNYRSAASISGHASIHAHYAGMSEERGVRMVMHIDSSRNVGPGRFDRCWFVIDTSANPTASAVQGVVLNWDSPSGRWGSMGRPVFKFDAFRREDAMFGTGLPGVLMTHQDLVNIARSTQLQQMVNVVHGFWLVDKGSANRDEFMNQLSGGVGGVLQYDTRNGALKPPQFVHPQPPDQTWPLVISELAQAMMGDSHQTQQSLGVSKSHVPTDVQMAIMESGGVVFDGIGTRDAEELSEAIRCTLGTVRRHIESGGAILAHLRDEHGFTEDDLLNVLEIDPDRINLDVKAVRADLTTRSAEQRIGELHASTMAGVISPTAMRYERASKVGRPLLEQDSLLASFCERGVRQIIDGFDWPGVPSVPSEMFAIVARDAIAGLDPSIPEDAAAIQRIEQAIQRQIALGRENPELQNPALASAAWSVNNQAGSGGSGTSAPRSPASIDPSRSPIGAAGGLPLGLAPSLA